MIAAAGPKGPQSESELDRQRQSFAAPSATNPGDLLRAQLLCDALRPVMGAYGQSLADSTRLRQEWTTIVGSADELQGIDRERIVSFSRSLHAQSPVAAGFKRSIVQMVVGDGVYPQGNTPAAKRACAAFWAWAETEGHADFMGRDGLVGLQRIIVGEAVEAGDVLPVRVNSRDDRPLGFAVQLITSERLTNAVTGLEHKPPTERRVIDGVELDAHGRISAFHAANYAWIGVRSTSYDPAKPTRFPAEFGSLVAVRERADQTRGLPYMASCMGRLAGLEEYHQAVEVAAKLAACIALITKTDSPQALANAVSGGATTEVSQTGTMGGMGNDQSLTRMLMAAGPATVLALNENGDVKTLGASQPGQSFEMFTQVLLRTVAGAAGFPIEVALGDYSRANYSVARMALHRAFATASVLRDGLIRSFLRPLYRAFLEYAVYHGMLEGEVAPMLDVVWIGPRMPSPDPVKDGQARAAAISQNMMSLRRALEDDGLDLETILAERAYEVKRQREMGITPPAPAGSAPTPPEQDPDATGGGAENAQGAEKAKPGEE